MNLPDLVDVGSIFFCKFPEPTSLRLCHKATKHKDVPMRNLLIPSLLFSTVLACQTKHQAAIDAVDDL